jgi:NitT/TauT family transport system permease protein
MTAVAARIPVRRQSLPARVWHRSPGAVVLVVIAVAWEVLGELGLFAFLPSLRAIADAGVTLLSRGEVWGDWGQTLLEVFAGLAIAVAAGLVLGIAMARSRVVEALFGHYVDLFQSAPVSALVPILVLVFGLGRGGIIATVTLFAFFVFTVNTYVGVQGVDPRAIEMARSFGAGRLTILFKVIIPGALPMILTGLSLAIGRGFNGGILGEMLISVIGIGGLLMYYGGAFQAEFVYALMFMVVIVAVVLMTIVGHFAERVGERRR